MFIAKNSRAGAVQLPARNEALGLPGTMGSTMEFTLPTDHAYETDFLEFDDVFEGSTVLRSKVNLLKKFFYSELKKIDEFGDNNAIENSCMKSQLVMSQTQRQKNIETGMQKVVGVNCFEEGETSPLVSENDGGFSKK